MFLGEQNWKWKEKLKINENKIVLCIFRHYNIIKYSKIKSDIISHSNIFS